MIEDFVETRSGLKVNVQNPAVDAFDIKDIAYALSNTCRFNGHCAGFYSVAEHSVAVALRLPRNLRLAGLLHDATEAYLGDVPSPIKQFLPDYKEMEHVFTVAIGKKFDVDLFDPAIKEADVDALFTEAHFLIPSQGKDWAYFQGPKKFEVDHRLKPVCLPPQAAFQLFMGCFYDLQEKDTRIVLPA